MAELVDSSAIFPAWARPLYRPFQGAVEGALGLRSLNQVYARCQGGSPEEFAAKVLADRGVRWQLPEAQLARLREQRGPLIVAANHPFGGLEALVLLQVLQAIRPDYRLMANYLLKGIAELQPRLILVDPFEGAGAQGRNSEPMRQALSCLRAGGLLGVFPAGEVSTYQKAEGRVADKAWSSHVAALARKTGAAVLPLHFEGHNGALFHAAGRLSPRLRTLLLPRALVKPAVREIKFSLGEPISAARLEGLDGDQAAADYLRARCYLLREDLARDRPQAAPGQALAEEIAAPILAAEVEALRAQGKELCAQGPYAVLCFRPHEAPVLFGELARLRELSFRATGEGTGKPKDEDEYDPHYEHLLLWDSEAQRIAGAYRLAEAGRLMAERGPQGLYCYSLFKLKPALLAELEQAVELGRSFVHPDYQKDFAPLLLLWRGIGAWIAQHPHVTRLFGCVSISPDFKPMTQQLLVSFLSQQSGDARRSGWAVPRSAFRLERGIQALLKRALPLRSMKELQEHVDVLEGGSLSVPTLIKHYLKLGGRILAFNVDASFNYTLDGLIMVELPLCPPRILEKYMGPQAAQAYLARHQERKAA